MNMETLEFHFLNMCLSSFRDLKNNSVFRLDCEIPLRQGGFVCQRDDGQRFLGRIMSYYFFLLREYLLSLQGKISDISTPAASFTWMWHVSSLNLTVFQVLSPNIATLWFRASRYEFCGGHKHLVYKAYFMPKKKKKEKERRASWRDNNYTKLSKI